MLGKESPTKEGRQQWEQLFENILRPFSNIQKPPNRRQSCNTHNNNNNNNEIFKHENLQKIIHNNNVNNENNENHNSCNHLNNLMLQQSENHRSLSLTKNNQNGMLDGGCYELLINKIDETKNNEKKLNDTLTTDRKEISSKSITKLSFSAEGSPNLVPSIAINCNGTVKSVNDSLVS